MKRIVLIFLLFSTSGSYSQNAYYDSYKILAVYNFSKDVLKNETSGDELAQDLWEIKKGVESDFSQVSFKETLRKVNSAYNRIYSIANLGEEELNKRIKDFDNKIKSVEKELDVQEDTLNEKKREIEIQIMLINDSITKLEQKIPGILKLPPFTVTAKGISNNDNELNELKKKLDAAVQSGELEADIQDLFYQIAVLDSMYINFGEITEKIESISNSLKDFEESKKRTETLKNLKAYISTDFDLNNEAFQKLFSKNVSAQSIDPSKLVEQNIKDGEISKKQDFAISEAAVIQIVSDIIISGLEQSTIIAAVNEFIDNSSTGIEKKLFKNTINYIRDLKSGGGIAIPVILKKVKVSIYKDFEALPENILQSGLLNLLVNDQDTKDVINTIIPFIKLLKDKKHPVEILSIAEIYVKDGSLPSDIKASLLSTLILQRNLRDLSSDEKNVQIWLSSDKILNMLKNPEWSKLFISCIEENLKNEVDYPVYKNLVDNVIKKIDNIKSELNSTAGMTENLIFNFDLTLNKFEKSIETINNGINEESILVYFESFKEFIGLYDNFIYKKDSTTIKIKSVIDNSITIIECISNKDYINMVPVFSKILKDYYSSDKRNSVLISLSEKLAILDGIMNSNSNEELRIAVTSVVDKYGGYAGKVENGFTLGINAYLGMFGGIERLSDKNSENSGNLSGNVGLSVPIGLNFSFPFLGSSKMNIIGQVFDFTAPINYRFSHDEQLPSDIKLKQLISPGILAVWNPSSKYPVGVGIGYQYMPELRKINEESARSGKFGLYLFYDLPLFNIIH